MTRFTVRAITPAGETRTLPRDGRDEHAVALGLLQENLTPVTITPQDGGVIDWLHRPIGLSRAVHVRDAALFCEQLAAMVSAGLTVEQALKVVSRQAKKRPTTRLARELLPHIQAGASLSAALETAQGLPPYLAPMIQAAETSGRLADGLDNASRYLQRQALTRGSLQNALTYPAIVLATVVIALILMLTVVIPSFAPIFAGEESRLPEMTRWVLWASDVAVNHATAAFIGSLALAVFLFVTYIHVKIAQQIIGRLAERILPVRLMRLLDVSRTLGVMGMLFDAGIEASEAMGLGAESASSIRLKQSLTSATARIRAGGAVTDVLREIPGMPADTTALIEVGEHTGSLGRTMLRAAHLLESDTARRLERMVALIEPFAIVVLGLIVGMVVSGVMLGILSINQLALTR